MQMNFWNLNNDHLLLKEKQYKGYEFLAFSLRWLEKSKYKSLGKYLVNAWEKSAQEQGLVESIEFEKEKLYLGKVSWRVLITFPWKGERHINIWIDDYKNGLEALVERLELYKEKAKELLKENNE